MRGRPQTLRMVLLSVTVAMLVVAAVAASSLVVLTRALERSVASLSVVTESLGAVHAANDSVRRHRIAETLAERRTAANAARLAISELSRHVGGPTEAAIFDHAKAALDRYLHAAALGRSASELAELRQEAQDALDALAAVNVADGRRTGRAVAGLDRLGLAIAAGTLAILLVVVAAFLWWLRRMIRCISNLGEAMERYGHLDREARAEEIGPTELRDIARRFNDMADTLDRHHRDRLALVGGIAHDFATPLTALGLSLDAVPMGSSTSAPAAQRALARAHNQVTRLERMVRDLLDLSASDAGELSIEPVRTDLAEIVDTVVEQFEGRSLRHRLVVTRPDPPLPVACDRGRIEQVLGNLVSNAIKYSPHGGPVEITVEPGPASFEISVRDHGIGIAPADQERIFEPFGRGAAAARTATGVGLGLSVAHRIVEAHGGSMRVEPAESEGTIVHVVLPRDHGEGPTENRWVESARADSVSARGVRP